MEVTGVNKRTIIIVTEIGPYSAIKGYLYSYNIMTIHMCDL